MTLLNSSCFKKVILIFCSVFFIRVLMLQSLKFFISTIYFYFFKKKLLYFNWRLITLQYCDVHLSSMAQACPILCDPMDCNTPGFPVHHQLPELAQTHVYWVSDVIQPSHSLASLLLLPSIFPSISVFSMNQFFSSGGQSIGASATASVLPMNDQNWFPLGLIGWISLLFKELPRVFSNTTVQKYQFFGAQLSLWSNFHIHTWLLEKP